MVHLDRDLPTVILHPLDRLVATRLTTLDLRHRLG